MLTKRERGEIGERERETERDREERERQRETERQRERGMTEWIYPLVDPQKNQLQIKMMLTLVLHFQACLPSSSGCLCPGSP